MALDLPGHGRSSGIDGPASIEASADVVLRVLEAVTRRPCVLVGRSMGGAVALVVAARAPERLRGLVLACSAACFPLPDEMIATARAVASGRLPQQFGTETFSPATGMDVMREAWMEQVKTDPRVRLTDLLACKAFDGRPLLRADRRADAGRRRRRRHPHAGRARRGARRRGIAGARLEVIAQAGHQAPARAERAVQQAGRRLRGALRMSVWGTRGGRGRVRASDALRARQDRVPDPRRERARRARRRRARRSATSTASSPPASVRSASCRWPST